MASKTRLANKTIWALEEIVALCGSATSSWGQAMERAERQMDPGMMLALARLRDALAETERIARDARSGVYREGRHE